MGSVIYNLKTVQPIMLVSYAQFCMSYLKIDTTCSMIVAASITNNLNYFTFA